MLVLFTDYGLGDPYVGQMKARIYEMAPSQPVVDLLHEVPAFNAHAGAHLLAALAAQLPGGSVFVCVVDPGVGSAREAVVVMAGGRWFVGPDNGLLSVVAARNPDVRLWRIHWRPERLSPSFHGRDLFAIIAAEIASGDFPAGKLEEIGSLQVEFDAGDLARILYIDHYGNAWSGLRAEGLPTGSRLVANGCLFNHAETFSAVGKGEAFWYENSAGLLELAVNRGSAAEKFALKIGDPVQLLRPN